MSKKSSTTLTKNFNQNFFWKWKNPRNRINTIPGNDDSNGNRTRDSTLRGSRLNRLTMEPYFFDRGGCFSHLYLLSLFFEKSQAFFAFYLIFLYILQSLFQIVDNIIRIFNSDAETDQIWLYTCLQ